MQLAFQATMVGQGCGDLPVSQIPRAKVGLWVRALESLSTTLGGRGSGVPPPTSFPFSVPALDKGKGGGHAASAITQTTLLQVFQRGLAVPRNPGPRCSPPSFGLPSAATIAQHEKGHPYTKELRMSQGAEGPSLSASLNLDASRPLLKASPPRAALPPAPGLSVPSARVRSPALPGRRSPNTSLATSEGNSMIRAAQGAA